MILPILQIGNEILNEKCSPVENFDDELKKLLDDMKQTLADAKGAGLAAPQVGKSLRVFIVDTDDGYFEFVNPVILGTSGSQYGTEGCLSVKGKWGDVKRPKKVTVEAYDRNGNKFKHVARNFSARAVCHEYDHLDGVLYVEKANNLRTTIRINESNLFGNARFCRSRVKKRNRRRIAHSRSRRNSTRPPRRQKGYNNPSARQDGRFKLRFARVSIRKNQKRRRRNA